MAIVNRLLKRFLHEHDEHPLGVSFRESEARLNAVLPESYHETGLIWLSLNWQDALDGKGGFEGVPENDHNEATVRKDDALTKLKAFKVFQRNEHNITINRLCNERDIAERECKEDTFHGNPSMADFMANGLPSKNPNANPSTNAAFLQRLIECNPNITEEESELVSAAKGETKWQQYQDTYWDKKISLDDFRLSKDMPEPPDPLESYPSYQFSDDNLRFEILENTINVDALTRSEDAYVYDDKGVDNFGATYSINLDARITVHSNRGIMGIWCLANDIDDIHGLATTGKDAHIVYFNRTSTGAQTIALRELNGGTAYTDTASPYSLSTRYYFNNERILGGSFGIIKSNIFTDANHTLSFDILSLNLHADHKFRYVYAAQSFNLVEVAPMSGDIKNLDLAAAAIVSGRRRRLLIGRA